MGGICSQHPISQPRGMGSEQAGGARHEQHAERQQVIPSTAQHADQRAEGLELPWRWRRALPGMHGKAGGWEVGPLPPTTAPAEEKKIGAKEKNFRKIGAAGNPGVADGWGGGVVAPPTSHRVWGIPVQPGRSRFTSWEVSNRVGSRGCCTKKNVSTCSTCVSTNKGTKTHKGHTHTHNADTQTQTHTHTCAQHETHPSLMSKMTTRCSGRGTFIEHWRSVDMKQQQTCTVYMRKKC